MRPDGDDDEANGVIRGWLRRADEFLKRPSSKGVTGKTGGSPAPADPFKDKEQSGSRSKGSQEG